MVVLMEGSQPATGAPPKLQRICQPKLWFRVRCQNPKASNSADDQNHQQLAVTSWKVVITMLLLAGRWSLLLVIRNHQLSNNQRLPASNDFELVTIAITTFQFAHVRNFHSSWRLALRVMPTSGDTWFDIAALLRWSHWYHA